MKKLLSILLGLSYGTFTNGQGCTFLPDSNPHSLLSYRTLDTYGTNVPLYIRHDNYVSFISPDENSGDDTDSTFITYPGLTNPKINGLPTVSFMTIYDWGNVCNNINDYSKCYYLQIDPTTQRLTLAITNITDPTDQLRSTFILHPGFTDVSHSCSLESASNPGFYLSSFGYSLPIPTLSTEEQLLQQYKQVKAEGELRRYRKFKKAKPFSLWGPLPQEDYVHYAENLEFEKNTYPSTPMDSCGSGYQDCPPVFAINAPSPSTPAWKNSSTWYISPPNSGPPLPGMNFTFGGLTVTLRDTNHAIEIINLVDDPMPPYNFSF